MNLSTKVTELNRVGKTLEKRLKHLGVETVRDLLFYFPFRYEDYSQVTAIKDLKDGMQTTIKGKIELIASKRSPRKRKFITEAVVVDDTDRIRVVWFGQPFISKILKVGDIVYLSGKIDSDIFGVQMKAPSYEKSKVIPTEQQYSLKSHTHRASVFSEKSKVGDETTHTARIVPMYSLTSGITQKQLRFLMSQVVGEAEKIEEWLPEEILDEVDLITLPFALKAIHFPETKEELKQAESRIKFGELFVLQLRAEMIRQSIKNYSAPKIKFKESETKDFVGSLPFELTRDQKISSWEILQDMENGEPMNRLVEGDVGSGKTVVAGIAAYNVALNGLQTVIMAPTEVLAFQHCETLSKLFKAIDVSVGLLTRSKAQASQKSKVILAEHQYSLKSQKSFAAQKRQLIKKINGGSLDVVIGTHALLTEDVEFKNLGLVVVDEQHRFGVDQRKMIREKSGDKNTVPHFLSMTATPIPRSFALTLYGDLDLSIIKTMPIGRKPIMTRMVESRNREKAYEFIKKQVEAGRQTFVICPLIEEKNEGSVISNQVTSDKKSVMQEYEKLSKKIFPELKIEYLHGKMKSGEKDKTMEQFSNGTIDILVSTSVVEVGVDVPNATVMMIEGAERFGLAQLHQFRGRVGRSEHQSYCFLFTDSDTDKVKKRLEFFEKNNDGFKVAEYDLEMRGPGEVYGVTQSGMMNFKLASMKDYDLIKLARKMARDIDFDKYSKLKEMVKEWEGQVHLE